jgi:hypothetical protein
MDESIDEFIYEGTIRRPSLLQEGGRWGSVFEEYVLSLTCSLLPASHEVATLLHCMFPAMMFCLHMHKPKNNGAK